MVVEVLLEFFMIDVSLDDKVARVTFYDAIRADLLQVWEGYMK